MCAVSMVVDFYRTNPPWDGWINIPNNINRYIEILEEIRKLREMLENIEDAKRLDKKVGIKDCEPKKEEDFRKEVLRRLDKLEEWKKQSSDGLVW